MAKKRGQSKEEQQRQSRKEILLARKQQRQSRQVRLAVIGIIGLLSLVLLAGLVNEFIIKPTLPVASVHGAEITMKEWQDRVRLQRAQLIISIENLAENLGQDIGQVQQFAGQQISLLEIQPEALGQAVLEQMVDEELIRQAAASRGISISDADVEQAIEESLNYYKGAVPTPFPTPTETVIPTPSLTPIPTEVITEVLPTNTPFPTPTLGPTFTPPPTSTPVSLESFQESYNELIAQYNDLGIDGDSYRELVRNSLYTEKFIEDLAVTENLSDEGEQVSFLYLAFESVDEANEALSIIEENGFVTTWNTVRSTPQTGEESTSTAVASEVIWRTPEELQNAFGEEVVSAAFEQPIEEPGSIIVIPATDEQGVDRYFILYVTGREIRPLSESIQNNRKQELLRSWLDEQKLSGVELFDRWQANVPTSPILDRRFLAPPTPTPELALPTVEAPSE